MLFLTFGNLFIYGLQFISEMIRCQRYRRAMQRLLRTASIFVQRTRKIQTDDLMKTSLLNYTGSSENVELEDDYIQISSKHPVQEIDLSTWTAYTSYLENHKAVAEPDVCLLVEARRLEDLEKLAESSLRIPPAYRVHVLSIGCPLAWKTAEPFGIILRCSLSGLVSLSDAFGQGWLTLDEDLELTGFVTVKTRGSPQSLIAQSREILCVKDQPLKADNLLSSRDGSNHALESSVYSGDKAQISGMDKAHISGTDKAQISRTNEVTHSASYERSIDQLPSISSNNNFEVDHTEEFVVKHKSAQISGKKQTDSGQASKKTSDSIQNNTQDESALVRHEGEIQGPRLKPPNILVYCGIKDSARKFAEAKSSLESCINTEAYTIYHLSHDSVVSAPWRSNTALLVVSSCPQLRQEAQDEIANFVLKDSGVLLSFNSSVDSVFVDKSEEKEVEGERLCCFRLKDAQNITSIKGRFLYSNFNETHEVVVPYEAYRAEDSGVQVDKAEDSRSDEQGKALVVKVKCPGGGVAVLSQLLLERDPAEYARDQDSFAALKQSNTDRLAFLRDLLTSLGIDTGCGTVPALTPCLLLAQRVGLKESFLESFKHRLKDGVLKSQKMSLKFVYFQDQAAASASLLPVITNSEFDAKTEYFCPQSYWKNLKTSKLGQVLFYCDVITSTMSVFDGLQFSVPDDIGLIAIAGRQTSGRGRGGNSWLSPVGCAMFTLPLSVSLNSELGQRVSFLQHIVSLAVVEGVLTLPGYENLDIRLKWPNDIYYGKEMKLGGVLVTSTVMESTIYATIGCGYNVSNSNPTICINDIIKLHNISHPHLPELSPLNPSQLIARTLTCLEGLLQNFEKNGHHAFCDQYYKHWLHGGAKVHLQLDKETDGEIVGLDDYGFLSVLTPDGVISVQPDGNSFDMLHNLIHIKPRS